MGSEAGYTLAHYNRAMKRFVSYFKPILSPLIEGLDANATARFLQSQNTPSPPRQRHLKALRATKRPIGMELRTIMCELHIRATGYHAEDPADQHATLINHLMLNGLQQFTAGRTNHFL